MIYFSNLNGYMVWFIHNTMEYTHQYYWHCVGGQDASFEGASPLEGEREHAHNIYSLRGKNISADIWKNVQEEVAFQPSLEVYVGFYV